MAGRRSLFESLESRRLLAVDVNVVGSNNPDSIILETIGTDLKVSGAQVGNGTYPLADITSLSVDGGNSNDSVTIKNDFTLSAGVGVSVIAEEIHVNSSVVTPAISAGGITLSSNLAAKMLVVTDQAGHDADLTFEVAGANYIVSSANVSPPSNTVITVAVGSTDGVDVNTGDGSDTIRLKNFAGKVASLDGGSDSDVYRFDDQWGDVDINDDGGTIGFADFAGTLAVCEPGGDMIIKGGDGSQVSYLAAGIFDTGLLVLDQADARTALHDGLDELAALGTELESFDRLGESLTLLDGQSIGNFLDIGTILSDAMAQPIEDYLAGLPAVNLDKLVEKFNDLDGDGYTGEGNLVFAVDTTGKVDSVDGDVMTLDLSLSATVTHEGVELDLGDELLSLGGSLEPQLETTKITADLVTGFDWNVTLGVDVSTPGSEFYFVDFDSAFADDMTVAADINLDPVTFDLNAGLLGLEVGVFGPASAASKIKLDANITLATTGLDSSLDAGVLPDGVIDLGELQSRDISNDLNTVTATAPIDINLYARASGLPTTASISFHDNVFDAAAATLSHNFGTDSGEIDIAPFYNLDASAVLQVLQQFGAYLDVLSLKSFDNEPILLAAGTTIGELIDIDGLYRDEFLRLIELPPHQSATLLTDIVGVPESGETLSSVLGTSSDTDAEFTVTLRNGATFDVDVDGVTTLGAVANRIKAAAIAESVDASQFDVVINADGSITLVDKIDGNSEFKLTAKQNPSSVDYTAAARLGLTAAAVERDVVVGGDPERVIDVAPNPGPNFSTLQKMLSLPTPSVGGAPIATTVGPVSYDASTSTFRFTIDITKTLPNASDTLVLPDLGPLTDLVTTSTVDLENPTVTLHLPFELALTELGFKTPLSEATSLSELNLGTGVVVVEGADDVRVHVADGTTFTVDLDPDLAATALASLNNNNGVTTSGDNAADLSVAISDGTYFNVDIDANLASTDAPPATLGELIEAIQTAANAAAVIAGTAAAGAANDKLIDASSPFGTADSLVGRQVVVGDEIRTIVANTTDTLSLNVEWEAPPAAGDSYEILSHMDGFVTFDTARGTLSLSNADSFSVTGISAAGLGLAVDQGLGAGVAVARTIGGDEIYMLENPLVTLGEIIRKIETAAGAAGLTLPTTHSFTDSWEFDVQIVGAGIELVDRTNPAAAMAGTAEDGAAANELKDTGAFASFDPDALAGRVVNLLDGGGDVVESLKIIANTIDTLTLDADWETPPANGDAYEIPNGLIVEALNDSAARVGLGLAASARDQQSVANTPLFDGGSGIVVRTNGTTAADLIVTLSGGTNSFQVDLDAGSPTTIGDFASLIKTAAAGRVPTQFEVLTDSATGTVYLIDRVEAGGVETFTVTNGTGSFAATDLGLASGKMQNVDFETTANEFVIEFQSPAQVIGGDPLHGDTAAAHLRLASSHTAPHILFDVDLQASGGSGSGQYGPLAVAFSDLNINSVSSNVVADVTLNAATLHQLWGGLGDPFPWMVGDAPNYGSAVDLSMDLKPVPSIDGVSATIETAFDVDVTNLYEVRDGIETVAPITAGSDDVKILLDAVEQLTIPNVLDYLDTAGDYLVQLQTQSKLADRLPGMSTSIGELFGFGDAFKARVQELRELPDDLRPTSLQDLKAQLSAPLAGASLIAGLSFDTVDKDLELDLHLDLDAIQAQLPVTLDLTKLGLDLDAQGLQKVAAIVDTLKMNPLDVEADGVIDLHLGIDLSTSTAGFPFLIGSAGPGTGTEASFEVRAVNDDALSFTTLFGSMPVEVIGGEFVLDRDGSGASADPASYTVDLQSDAMVATTEQIAIAAGDASTAVQIDGRMDGTFDLAFPQTVIPSDVPATVPSITVGVNNLNDPGAVGASALTTNLLGGSGNWPTFEVLTQNFSLSDSMEGFKLGFHDVFTHLDQALDTALLGQNLPLVGKQLSEAADFLLQVRDSVVDNLEFYGKTVSLESVRQALFDAFGSGGYDWLQNDDRSGDQVVNVDDIKMVTQVINVGGRELVVSAEYQMELVMPPQLLEFPVDLDLLLPGLGLEIDALADVLFGFKLPLTVGISIADGMYLDVERANDLEISLDVALPSAAVLMSGKPNLTFSNQSTTAPRITRDRGNWILDGFRVGHIISVSGSDGNDGDYIIEAIDGTGLELTVESTDSSLVPTTIDQDRVVPEGPKDGISIAVREVSLTGATNLSFIDVVENRTFAFPAFTGIADVPYTIDLRDEISRSTGSWIEDGFRLGDSITITGTGSNDNVYTILAIDPTGRRITIDKVLTNESTSAAFVRKDQSHGLSAHLGVLPFQVWDKTPEQSELTGTFVIDLLDPAVIGARQRLSLNDLIATAPFPDVPPTGFNSAPLPDLMTITELAGHELTLHPLALTLETDLPPGAAFPPYRMDLDISGWDWSVRDSLISENTAPTIEFNNVQLELVGFVRDFLGPAITRMSKALEAVDPLLVFLQSEAVPILSLLFGRTSYYNAPGTFGGQAQIGDFTGAATALRALADGGQPFERDAIGEFFSDMFENKEFDDITLLPIMKLSGEEWIDLGSFMVNGAVARGQTGDLFDHDANGVRNLGKLNDAPLRLSGSPDLEFSGSTISRANAAVTQSLQFSHIPLLDRVSIIGADWDSLGFKVGDFLTVTDAGSFNGSYKIKSIVGTLMIADPGFDILPGSSGSHNASVVGNVQTWKSDGFQTGHTIKITGGLHAGTYVVASVSDTELAISGASFPTSETVPGAFGVEIAVQNADGTLAGSIFGQIAAIARDRTSSAQAAAQSFVTTQLLPGTKKVEGVGGLTNKIVNSDFFEQNTGLTVGSMKFPIFQQSFGLMLGETGFGGRSEAESHLLQYGTPELAMILYHFQPIGWENVIGTLVNRAVGKVVGQPLDSFKYAQPFVSLSFEARADYEMGFDTTGLKRFGITGNPDDIVDGFYFDDNEGVEPNPSALGNVNVGAGNQSGASTLQGTVTTTMDEAQVRILGGVGVGVFIDPFLVIAGGAFKDFIQARIGFELSLFLGQDQNFNDPNGDGRVRASEFDVLTGYSPNYSAGTYSGNGTDAFDDGFRIEVRGDVFASVKVGIFLSHGPGDFPLLPIGVKLIDIRINLFTIGFTIEVASTPFTPPDLGNQSGTVLALVFLNGQDNVLYVGASSSPDDAGQQDIVVSGRHFYEEFKGVDSITATGGTGDDTILVMHNVLIPVSLDGGGGNDILIGGGGDDTLVGGEGDDQIDGGAGTDIIHGDDVLGALTGEDVIFGGDGDDRIFGGRGHDVIRGWRDDDEIDGGDEDDLIDGGTGADIIRGGGGPDVIVGGIGSDTLRGDRGKDRIEGGMGADFLDGGDDEDLIFGGFGSDTIEGGADADVLFGEQHSDLLQGGTGNDALDGGGARDRVMGGDDHDRIKSGSGNDILNGERGDDTYQVAFAGGKAVSLIKVVESGPAEDNDTFVAIGTLQPDHFLLRASVSGSNAFVAMLSDPDHAVNDPGYDPAVQRINYLGVERIVVNGGLGNDHFAVDDTAAEITLNGQGGEDSFQIGQLFRSERNEADANIAVDDVFATIETTRGFLSNGISRPMTINGGLGNDRFVVFHNKAVLSLNGDAGDDEFEVRAFALVGSREPERARTDITGGAGADLVQYAVNAPVNINGGEGSDTLIVTGTEFGDDFVITDRGVFGAGLTINFTNIESLRVDGAEGDDRFFVQSTSITFLTELFGGLGEDTFNVSGDTPPVVSNDLLGHSGIITNDVTRSNDLRYEDLKLRGVSTNVADNDEPFVVIRTSGGSTIVGETASTDPTLIDYYEVVLSRAPMLGFDILVKALAPLPSPDQRELGALAFRLASPAPRSDEKADGSVVTLRFTADNWSVPQRVEIRADDVTQIDTGRLFTRPELSESVSFDYNDSALEGKQSAVINHLVVAAAATVEGQPFAVGAAPTITIATDRPFYEFLGENIRVTQDNGTTVQERRIIDARLVDGNMQLTVNRSWLAGNQVPDATSTFEIDLDGTPLFGSPLSAANATFTIADPLDPLNPFLDNVDDLLGRQVTIVDGLGTGQSRFITGADAVIGLSGSKTGIYHPQTASFGFDLTEGNQRIDVTSGATLNIAVSGDFDQSHEFLTVNVDGNDLTANFGGPEGRLYRPMTASIPLTQTQLQTIVDDGQIDLIFTPSNQVHNFDASFGSSTLSFDLQFTADATSAIFNKDVLGDLRLTLDRGWQTGDVPDDQSSFQIRIDDSLIGKVTGINESPVGLRADASYVSTPDARSTFTDRATDFGAPVFGPQGLRGATLEIVGGPGAGQQRLILDTLNSNTLILNGPWRTDPVAGESLYRIARYDGLAVPSVSVEIHDNDKAGLIVDEAKGLDSTAAGFVIDDYDTLTAVIEGGDGNRLGERDVIRVRLSRQPIADVEVSLEFNGGQLKLQNLDGSDIPGNMLSFNSLNWNSYQQVVVIASHDSKREGFHTTLIEMNITSADANTSPIWTDDFVIPSNEPVEFVGLSKQPLDITSVKYNGQSLLEYDSTVAAGTAAQPVWQLVGNKIVFRADGKITTVLGSDLHVSYQYERPGFDNVFTQPVLVRISDADAPAVIVRETNGSTDVVEGAPSFLTIEFSGVSVENNSLIDQSVTVTGGTGTGQTARIVGNTTSTLTVDQVWSILPDSSSSLTLSGSMSNGTSAPGFATGDVAVGYERDSHNIYLASGTSYTFDLEGSPTGNGTLPDPYLRLFDGDGRQVAYNDDGGAGYNSRIVFTPSVSGSYELSAGGYSNRTGTYKLSTQISGEIPAATSTPASLFVPGSTTGSVDINGDQDWFQVTLSAGNTYTFDLEGAHTSRGTLSDPLLRLLDSGGTEIARNDDVDAGTNLNSRIIYTAAATGVYYLSAQAYGNNTGTYALSGIATPAVLSAVSTTVQSLESDSYQLLLTAQPDDGTGSGTGFVEVTVTPEITKTTRTGGVRTDAKQVEIYNLDGLPTARVRVDPANSDNLIVRFDQNNWDEPVRIGVRAIDDMKVDGGDTKVFANGPNTLSEILGPVVIDGAGGDGSLVGIGPPKMLSHETNVKERTGDVHSVDGFDVTLQTLTANQLADLGLESDLSDIDELVGNTIEVVATHPTNEWLAAFPSVDTGNPNDPVVGQFRLITGARVDAANIVLTINKRFGVGDDAVVNVNGGTTSDVEITLSRQQQLQLGISEADDLLGRYLEVTNATGTKIGEGEITAAVDDGTGVITVTVAADFTAVAGEITGYFIRSDDLIKSYAITSESLNFFVREQNSVDFMFVHDEDSPADSTGYLTANRLWGLNMGDDITIGKRLRAGGISYGNLEVLQIDLGSGNNDFHVLGTHTRPDDLTTTEDESFQTWTFLNTGNDIFWQPTNRQGDSVTVTLNDGDVPAVLSGSVTSGANPSATEFAKIVDGNAPFGAANSLAGYKVQTTNAAGTVQLRTILGNTANTLSLDGVWSDIPTLGDSYEITNPGDGAFAVNTQDGNDVIDARGSTLGIVAFGGLGNDTITGGSGDDILFGDQGRVDYFGDDDGHGNHPIVTRLGTSADPISGTATGDFSDNTTLLDTNATFSVADGFDIGLRGLFVDINNGTAFEQEPRLITNNIVTSLNITPEFTETLDATSAYRISTYPEDQTDGFFREANLILTVEDSQGGNDLIGGGEGDDQIFGGAGDDDITGAEGDDIILGDNGAIDRAAVTSADPGDSAVASVVDLVRTKSPAIGGRDMISGGDDNDIILAGFGTDYVNFDRAETQLVGESGNDLIIGDNGLADFDVSNRQSVLVRIETNQPNDGSKDFITAGDGEKIIFGGAGGDALLAGSDDQPDIVIGDEGVAIFDPSTGIRTSISTRTETIGGNDTITAGNAVNFLLGGSGADHITGGNSRDAILGDNGRLDFIAFDSDPSTLDRIITIEPTLGGADTIFGGDDNDIIIGGTAGDEIHGGGDHDVLFGDHAEIDYSRPVDRNVISRFITDSDGGGIDTIEGDAGDDFIFGGQAGDFLYGGQAGNPGALGSGQDDIVGGHNVPFGADGDDVIEGGDQEDVILGDNGIITRTLLSPQLGTWENYLAPFDHVTIREVQPFDDRDLVAGNDTLRGDAGMDILRGQRGDDKIHGGDDDDELIGGLGSDEMFGDAGQDFLLADAGQILRDFNSDGTPQLNSDGTWHRDLLTEEIGHVTNVIPIEPGGLTNPPANIADQLLGADRIIFAGVELPSGVGNVNNVIGQWQTVALLIDLVDADDDTDLDGGEGNDIVLGQRGNDTIHGGLGDDTLIGDHGINTAPMETDLPQMIDSIRLIGIMPGASSLSGVELNLPGFGHVIVPELVAQPGDLVAERPRWDRVTAVNSQLSKIARGDNLTTTDDLRISPAISVTPQFIGHTDVLDGSDFIYGDGGADLLFGDKMIVSSELQTGIDAIDEAIERATGAVAGVMYALEGLSLDRDVVRYELDQEIISEPTIRVANDWLEGGAGDDTVIGDDGVYELPATHKVPGTGTVAENAAQLHQHLADLETLGDDASQLVTVAHLGVIDQLLADALAARPALPAVSGNDVQHVVYHELIIGNDTLRGDNDNTLTTDDDDDLLLGADALLIAPLVTGTPGDLPDAMIAEGLDSNGLDALEIELDALADVHAAELADRRDARTVKIDEELSRRTPLDRIAYVPSLDRSIDNDGIQGGAGDDVVAGDDSVIATPLVLTAPTTDLEQRELDRHVELLLDQISNRDRAAAVTSFDAHVGRVRLAESTTDALSPEARHGAISGAWGIGNDNRIDGDDGDDILLGDHVAIVSPLMIDDATRHVSLRRSAYGIGYLEDAMREFLNNRSLDGVDIQLQHDVLDGGEHNDVILGGIGDDQLDGRDGNDVLRGGNGRDILRGGSDTNILRDDGGNYPHLDLSERLGALRFDTTTPTTTQLLLDAADGATTPANWITTKPSTDPNATGDGEPDAPPTPVARTIQILGNEIVVPGQPFALSALITDMPATATPRLLWEITDSGGKIVATGSGATLEFIPENAGNYQATVTGTDSDNGLGTASTPLTVQDAQLIPDPDHPGQRILVVGGTALGDDVRLNDVSGAPHSVEVRQSADGPWTSVTYHDISRIDVYGGDGDDDLTADRRLSIPVRLYGGAGNDKLRGGTGDDFLDGGAGRDRLHGQSGDDVLVGGWGADRIDAGDGEDLMITDYLSPVTGATDADALARRWADVGTSVADRMADLISDLGDAITGDGAIDDADGDAGHDWFFSQLNDLVRHDRFNQDAVTLF